MGRIKKTAIIPPLLAAEIELWKRGSFDFICKQGGKHHQKQEEALKLLTDDEHVEFLYGGAAGGAKSWTGWCLLAMNRHSESARMS